MDLKLNCTAACRLHASYTLLLYVQQSLNFHISSVNATAHKIQMLIIVTNVAPIEH